MCNEYDSSMKTFLLSTLFLAGIAMTAAVQKVHLKAYNLDNQQRCGQYWIDRNAQKFYFDSDSEDDATMQMKNYKKTGNKETFDIYHKGQGEDMGSVELLIDPNLKVVDDLSKQYIIINSKMYNGKIRLGVVSEGQKIPGEAKEGRPDKGNTPDANLQEKAEGNVKEKAKNLLNKGKNLFKKK